MKENAGDGKVLWSAKRGKTVQDRKSAGRGQAAQRALRTAGAIVGVILLSMAVAAPLCAQSYPNKPIRFIVRFPPGGGDDTTSRIIGPKLAERLGQPVVLENRGGAGGNVGAEIAANTAPDGYNLVMGSTGLVISPSLYKKLNYDPIRDFTPISLVARIQSLLLVRSSLPVKSLKEFVEYARANPGKLNITSAGVGTSTHLAGALLMSLTKIEMAHVTYKGGGPALIGLMSGEADMMVLGVPSSMPAIQSGKVRALALLSEKRIPSLPDVPTAQEAGLDNYVVTAWYGLMAPTGTPREIINRLNAECARIVAMPDTQDKMQKAGLDPATSTPEEFSEFVKAETARWAKVVKDANIPRLD